VFDQSGNFVIYATMLGIKGTTSLPFVTFLIFSHDCIEDQCSISDVLLISDANCNIICHWPCFCLSFIWWLVFMTLISYDRLSLLLLASAFDCIFKNSCLLYCVVWYWNMDVVWSNFSDVIVQLWTLKLRDVLVCSAKERMLGSFRSRCFKEPLIGRKLPSQWTWRLPTIPYWKALSSIQFSSAQLSKRTVSTCLQQESRMTQRGKILLLVNVYYLRACCKQVLFLGGICVSVRT